MCKTGDEVVAGPSGVMKKCKPAELTEMYKTEDVVVAGPSRVMKKCKPIGAMPEVVC